MVNNSVNKNIIISEKGLDFILSGKAIFTVLNTKTENRFTFKVVKKNDIYFVNVLTNPDHYEFIGFFRKDIRFRHSTKSRISFDSNSVKVINWLLIKLVTNTLPDFVEIWHEGKCGKCGKSLTDPNSILSGFGPICSQLIKH